MTVYELSKALKSLRIPSFIYNIDILGKGLQDQRVCLTKEGEVWNVFMSERNHRFGLKQYKSEADACEDVLKRVLDVMHTTYGFKKM